MSNSVISVDNGMAEGVYAASGCYTASAYIHQTPQTGRGDYRIQVNGHHDSDHTKESQVYLSQTNIFYRFNSYMNEQKTLLPAVSSVRSVHFLSVILSLFLF